MCVRLFSFVFKGDHFFMCPSSWALDLCEDILSKVKEQASPEMIKIVQRTRTLDIAVYNPKSVALYTRPHSLRGFLARVPKVFREWEDFIHRTYQKLCLSFDYSLPFVSKRSKL